MDLVTKCAAAVLFAWAILGLMYGPFLISKPRARTYTAGIYLLDAAVAVAMIIVAGRVFGWW